MLELRGGSNMSGQMPDKDIVLGDKNIGMAVAGEIDKAKIGFRPVNNRQ